MCAFVHYRMYTVFFLYLAIFVTSAVLLFRMQYLKSRTSSFITLDKTSGVCKSDSSLSTCCEVPATITGQFNADTDGACDTSQYFSYVKSNYGVTLSGLSYTNSEWSDIIKYVCMYC